MYLKPIVALVLFGITACTLTGCVTSALWEEGRFKRMHEPVSTLNLRLFLSRDNESVLVQYDEWIDGRDSKKVRAYWVDLENQPARNPHRPRFVSAKESIGLIEIPLCKPEPDFSKTNSFPFAVEEVYPIGFTLHLPDRNPARYDLPVYEDSSGRTKQILLTPLCVTADATIAAGYLFLWYIANGGGCWH